jgi:hypothetical protein
LRDCPHDATDQAEGTVWTHVRMVCEALPGLDEFRALAPAERQIVFAAALPQHVAKPTRTRGTFPQLPAAFSTSGLPPAIPITLPTRTLGARSGHVGAAGFGE